MFLQTVTEVVNQFLFPKFIEECNRLLQIQRDACDSVCQQCLHENYQEVIEKEQCPPNNSQNLNTMEIACWGATHKAILKPSSKAQNSF